MRNAFCPVLSLMSGVFLFGCTIVSSVDPVGEKPAPLKEKDWIGAWYDGDSFICFIKVKDEARGILRAAVLNTDKKDAEDFSLRNFDVQIRKNDGLMFANILYGDLMNEKDVNEENAKTYVWFMLVKLRGKIVLYMPNGGLFEKLIKAKKLKGKIIKDGIVVSASNENFRKLIDSRGKSGELFNWTEPITLRRLMKK
ncbi:MAG: hypothetical protein GXP32_04385 [Kiritimatiellaeota bacterium]|nr:hypothetical protein [Kiritimatiellota bacterium]